MLVTETQQKIRGVSITQNIVKRSLVNAIPPVNDALPGNQRGVGYPLVDQLNFGWLEVEC